MKAKLLGAVSSILLAGGLLVSSGYGQVGVIAARRADQRVETLLEAAQLKYQIDEDGDFALAFKFEDGRTQIAWILSNTTYLGPIEIREVWSIGYRSKEPISPEIATRLLEQNGRVKLGAWHIRKMGSDYVAVFAAQVAADTDQTTLRWALHAVTTTADEMEKELTQKDEF